MHFLKGFTIMDRGYNSGDMLNGNRSHILRFIHKNKICTRAQISSYLGLTPASITKTMATLINSGLVEETGFIQGEKGRRSIGIALRSDSVKVIGVKLSRRNYAIGVFDLTGNIVSNRFETIREFEELSDVLRKIKSEIINCIERHNVVAIGMAVPGPFFENEGHVMLVTETEGWSDINLQEYFSNAFPIPMIIKHDANTVALAEWLIGNKPGENFKTIVSFVLGEGVGAGVLIDGTTLSGSNGIAAEIGHISLDINGPRCDCGNYGCLELYCSSINFVKNAKEQLHDYPDSLLHQYSPLTYNSIFEAAQSGDELAIKLVKRVGRYVGYGAINLIIAYDPDSILISSDLSKGGEILLEEIRKVVRERVSDKICKNVNIEFSRLQDDSILCGAAAVAIDYCLQNPEHLLEMTKKQNPEHLPETAKNKSAYQHSKRSFLSSNQIT